MSGSAETKLEGDLIRFSYRADSGAFAVAQVFTNEEITAVGPLGHVTPGQHVVLFGKWKRHISFGRQFQVDRVLVDTPQTTRGIIAYLANGDIKGLGPVYAKRVVEHFGLDTLEILKNTPKRLLEVRGIGKKRLGQILVHLREETKHREVMASLRGLEIGDGTSRRLIQRYGEDTLAIIAQNPYRLVQDVRGIGFKKADTIALTQGIAPNSPLRIEAGIHHLLNEAESQGHCYLPYSEFKLRAARISIPVELVNAMLDEMIEDARLYCSDKNAADPPLSRPQLGLVEHRVATELVKITQTPPIQTLHGLVPASITTLESILSIKLNDEQKNAIESALSHQLLVITGGPGTGKTTIVRALMAAAGNRGENWVLSAPTGRAAKRLSETTGIEAKTIHRLLSYNGHSRKFMHNRDNPLKCHALLIDEASMLDIWLVDSVLQALQRGTKLVLIGDVDQLPSVGPGRVLGDVIESKVLPVVRLTEVYRQAKNSNIVKNAHRVNSGGTPVSCEADTEASNNKDFFVLIREDPVEAQKTLLEVVSQRLPRLGFNPLKEVQVLTPMHNGILGTQALNHLLQRALNQSNQTFEGKNKRFNLNDRVLQIRNDYDKDIFNGDVGFVSDLNEDGIQVSFDEKKVDLSSKQITDLELAYAVTVHKSQGSEYPAVVIVLHKAHRIMLRRNLLYTAMTRASSFVCIIGSKWAIDMAIKEVGGQDRWTMLKSRIIEEIDEAKLK